MGLPTTGNLTFDIVIAVAVIIVGLFVLVKAESRWGWLILAAGVYWSYSLVVQLVR